MAKINRAKSKIILDFLGGLFFTIANFSIILDSLYPSPVNITILSVVLSFTFVSFRRLNYPDLNTKKKFNISDISLIIFLFYILFRSSIRNIFEFNQEDILVTFKTFITIACFYYIPRYLWNRVTWFFFFTTMIFLSPIFAGIISTNSKIQSLILAGERASLDDLSAVALSTVFVPALVLSIVFVFFVSKRFYPILLFSIISSIYAILVSGTRSGLIAVFVSFILLFFIQTRKNLLYINRIVFNSKNKQRIILSLLVLLFFSICIIAVIVSPEIVVSIFGETNSRFIGIIESGLDSDNSSSERLETYAGAIRIFQESPIFGGGPKAYYPHNIFIEIISGYGLFGMAPFLVFLTTSIISSFSCMFNKYSLKIDYLYFGGSMMFVSMFVVHQISLGIFLGKCLFLSAALLNTEGSQISDFEKKIL